MMRARFLAIICAAVLLLPGAAVAIAADAPPAPPTVIALCATDKEFAWTVSSDATGLASYTIDFTTKRTADWTYPNGSQADLTPAASGGHSTQIWTSKADGATVYVRWTAFPDQVATNSTAPSSACAMATLAVRRVVQGGTATPDRFPASITRSITSFTGPALSESTTTAVTSDAAQSVQPGSYVIGPTKESGAYLPIPAGYVFRSNVCVGGDTPPGGTTDALYQRLIVAIAPGSSIVCTITYHYGPVLADSIAVGKKTTGTTGFTTATITVPKGTYVTYLVATSPSLAGRKVQIWTKTGSSSKPWKLSKTVTVASDGSVRYYAKVSVFTGFQARWPGDATYVASQATGRYAKVK